MKAIVCIPAYNEELTIASIIVLSKRYADKVCVINDGSKDRTAEVANAAGAVVLSHGKNEGYGAAINSCFEAAKKEKADSLVIIDGDGQHDPKDIPKVLEGLQNGADVVIGSRFHSKNEIPAYRRAGISALTTLTNAGSGVSVSDSQSGFRAYNAKAVSKLAGLRNAGMGAGSEILMKASEAGLKISEVPITVRYFDHVSKRNALIHGLGVTTSILDIIRLRKPFAFFGVLGVLALVLGGVFGIYTLDLYNANKALPFGPTILTVFFTLTGMLCVLAALILDSVSRIVESREENGE